MNEDQEIKRMVDIYCEAIRKTCEPFGIEVVNAYLEGNKVLVVKFNPSIEEKNQQEFERIKQLKANKDK